ncbi:MAG: response regulator transcription factor [Acidobacteria bacterium]|nr:response regulator transcription factor [Acidobacteriota bacterium]
MSRILVVEDDPGIALGLEEDLTLEGYGVETVSDGEAAVERASRGAFDLIVLDVMLPRKDGFQVCRELRRGGVTTPIILLTARTQEAEKVLGLQLGADDYVTKPFSPLELRARIQAVLRRTAGPAPAEIERFGDMELDLARCELRRAGERVDVTAVEFKLLCAFVRNRGRVLSRQNLLDKVWEGTECVDRVVDTHVSNLRRKIEPEPASPRYLVSVRGMGYRFDG